VLDTFGSMDGNCLGPVDDPPFYPEFVRQIIQFDLVDDNLEFAVGMNVRIVVSDQCGLHCPAGW